MIVIFLITLTPAHNTTLSASSASCSQSLTVAHIHPMSAQNQPLPPVPASPPSSGGVRRHHTISASSRTARAGARDPISEESQNQELWNEDEVVGEDWVGGVGAVGEKSSSLHRQSSLPTRYHRGKSLVFTAPSLSDHSISSP